MAVAGDEFVEGAVEIGGGGGGEVVDTAGRGGDVVAEGDAGDVMEGLAGEMGAEEYAEGEFAFAEGEDVDGGIVGEEATDAFVAAGNGGAADDDEAVGMGSAGGLGDGEGVGGVPGVEGEAEDGELAEFGRRLGGGGGVR